MENNEPVKCPMRTLISIKLCRFKEAEWSEDGKICNYRYWIDTKGPLCSCDMVARYSDKYPDERY